VAKDHPLQPIRALVDQIVKQLWRRFDKMYAKVGRPSIPPEQFWRALLLQMLYCGAQRGVADGRDRLTTFCFAGSWG
jgi:hypothetical protein